MESLAGAAGMCFFHPTILFPWLAVTQDVMMYRAYSRFYPEESLGIRILVVTPFYFVAAGPK